MSAKMFKVKSGCEVPVEVTAEIPRYPNIDSEGEMIFENTHFLSIEDAWSKLLREREAWVSLSCMTVKRLRKELSEAEKELADAAIARHDAAGNHEKWLADKNERKAHKH